MPSEQLFEYCASNASLKVDREAGLMRSVKILGHTSANGYRYLPEAIRKAAALYEGKVVNFNHAAKSSDSRSSYDRFGWFSGVQVREDGLYGDLHYLKSHPFTNPVLEAAERNPALFGMSHVANGNKVRRGNQVVVEDIQSVSSVDLVSDPATVNGLFESQRMSQKTIVREVLKAALKPEQFKLLIEQDLPAMGAEMASPEAGMDSTAQAHEAFKAMIMAVLDDTSLDVKAVLSKIKDILKAKEKLMGGGETSSDTSGEEGGEMAGEESKKKTQAAKPGDAELLERVTRMERRDAVRLLCDTDHFIPTATQLKALAGLTEEKEIKEMIGDHKGKAPAPGKPVGVKPRSDAPSVPITESAPKLPTTVQELKAFILN